MTADVLAQRAQREQVDSHEVRKRAEEALLRVQKAAARIRHMTALYRERLEGRRVQQP